MRGRCGRADGRRADPRGDRAWRSTRSTTSSTAAPPAPTRAPATAPASSSSSRTSSSAPARDFGSQADEIPAPRRGRFASPSASSPPTRRRRRELGALIADRQPRANARSAGATVPVIASEAGREAAAVAPTIRQLLIGAAPGIADQDELERRLFVTRRVIELALARPRAPLPQLLRAHARLQGHAHRAAARRLLPRPARPRLRSALADRPLALLHQHLPQLGPRPPPPPLRPQRRDQHLRAATTTGCARARRCSRSPVFGDDLRRCLPLIPEGTSDSAALRPRARAAPARRPPARPRADDAGPDGPRGPNRELPDGLDGFYRYHASLIEPWDGPAALVASDGRRLAAMLDRNGLRPGRWSLTRDGWLVLGSEAGMLPLEAEEVAHLERLHPGRLLRSPTSRPAASQDELRGRDRGRLAPPLRRVGGAQLARPRRPHRGRPRRAHEPLAARQLAFG